MPHLIIGGPIAWAGLGAALGADPPRGRLRPRILAVLVQSQAGDADGGGCCRVVASSRLPPPGAVFRSGVSGPIAWGRLQVAMMPCPSVRRLVEFRQTAPRLSIHSKALSHDFIRNDNHTGGLSSMLTQQCAMTCKQSCNVRTETLQGMQCLPMESCHETWRPRRELLQTGRWIAGGLLCCQTPVYGAIVKPLCPGLWTEACQ